LLEFDQNTETNREIKYTRANRTGSSRGVKIIVLNLYNTQTKKNVTINLIDTPGYEELESEEDLGNFYQNLMTNAQDQDSKYAEYLKNRGFEDEKKRIITEIRTETGFI